MTKIGIIGCGNISKFHIPALKKVGFSIVGISGREGSENKLKKFSKENYIENSKIFLSSIELIHSNIWDALLICCPTESSLEYLTIASKYKKPILAEKPITYKSDELFPLLEFDNIKVAFNRRFYDSVKMAKKFYDENKISLIKVSIPEKNNEIIDIKKFPISIYENSIHLFDLLNFITDKCNFHYCESLIYQKEYKTIIATGTGKKGCLIQLDICFNSSDNFSIDIISETKRVKLSPIEIARFYDGIEIVDPVGISIRRYNPIMQKEVITLDANKLKLGFYEQALDFYMFCRGEKNKGASIIDAYNNLKSIEQLVKLQRN